MDKYEYKVRADEIKSLIANGEYTEAVKIADTIDWRRVKSVMMLCTISDLYKINRRYEDSRDILLLAYDRHAGGRLIVYSLCELSIKLGEYVQALEYYKEFVQLAPKDSGRYILQYKLYEAQEVSLEERIEVLEEFKKRDYREKWAYELAYLYHRVGLASKCVEECDEMVLWFGEGRYVLKALELKQLHEPLSTEQQAKYLEMKESGGFITSDYQADQEVIRAGVENETEDEEDNEFSLEENMLKEDTQEMPAKDLDIEVKTVDVSEYNTLNLQKELAESMREFLENHKTQQVPVQEVNDTLKTQVYEPVKGLDDRDDSKEIQEKEPGAEPQPELRQDTDEMQLITEKDLGQTAGEVQSEEKEEAGQPEPEIKSGEEEVFFGNTQEVNIQDVVSELVEKNGINNPFAPIFTKESQEVSGDGNQGDEKLSPGFTAASPDPAISDTGVIRTFHKPSGYDNMLSQEYDGQISLVMPEQQKIEKQITGQLSIEDVMAEWERIKQENERKRMEEIRKRVHQQTDALFADFDESTKTGLLEELEKAMVTAAIKEEKDRVKQECPKVVKVADIEAKADQEEEELPEDQIEKTAPETILQEAFEEIEEEIAEEVLDESEPEVKSEEEIEIQDEPEEEKRPAGEDNAEETEVVSEEEISEPESDDASKNTADGEKVEKKDKAEESESTGSVREMSNSEREQFAPFIHHKKTRRQIVETLDNISMASYTGNVIITGEEGTEATALAKLLVKEVQLSDNNFSGKVAKISGSTMNKKDIGATLSKLSGGALIIEEAASMKKAATEQLLKELNQEEKGLIVLLEDTKAKMNDYLTKYPAVTEVFNLRVDVEALDDHTLVKYAKKYALDQEYAIDELGILALHTRIADMQTSDHEVTLAEIEELIDEAIYYADRKTPAHFFDVLLGKRYDEEDMIVLREKDFMHY